LRNVIGGDITVEIDLRTLWARHERVGGRLGCLDAMGSELEARRNWPEIATRKGSCTTSKLKRKVRGHVPKEVLQGLPT
jgi:hypothetical protein